MPIPRASTNDLPSPQEPSFKPALSTGEAVTSATALLVADGVLAAVVMASPVLVTVLETFEDSGGAVIVVESVVFAVRASFPASTDLGHSLSIRSRISSIHPLAGL